LTLNTSIIWPYWRHSKPLKSLHLSIDLAKLNLQFDKTLIVVGDNPKRDDVEYLSVPRLSPGEYRRRYDAKLKHQRCCDAVYKLKKAIASPKVSETFIRLYDDMYILQPVTLDDLLIQRHRGRVEPGQTRFKGWRELRRKTLLRLKESGLTTYDFSTHGPVVFEKTKLQQTIEQFDLMRQPSLVETIYQNQWLDPGAQLLKSSFFRFVSCQNDWDANKHPKVLCVQNNHIKSHLATIEKFKD
jgi:hypothetical protein